MLFPRVLDTTRSHIFGVVESAVLNTELVIELPANKSSGGFTRICKFSRSKTFQIDTKNPFRF